MTPLSLLEMAPLSEMMPLQIAPLSEMAPMSILEMAPLSELAPLEPATVVPLPRTSELHELPQCNSLDQLPTTPVLSNVDHHSSDANPPVCGTRCTPNPTLTNRSLST
jgi:hypothetical protein